MPSLFVAGLDPDSRFFISRGSDCRLLSRVSLSSFLHVPPLAVLGGLLCSGIVPCLLWFSAVSFQRLRRTLRMLCSSKGPCLFLISAFFLRFSSRIAFHFTQRLPKMMPPVVSKVACRKWTALSKDLRAHLRHSQSETRTPTTVKITTIGIHQKVCMFIGGIT